MKKILLGVLSLGLSFMLIGCSSKTKEIDEYKIKTSDEVRAGLKQIKDDKGFFLDSVHKSISYKENPDGTDRITEYSTIYGAKNDYYYFVVDGITSYYDLTNDDYYVNYTYSDNTWYKSITYYSLLGYDKAEQEDRLLGRIVHSFNNVRLGNYNWKYYETTKYDRNVIKGVAKGTIKEADYEVEYDDCFYIDETGLILSYEHEVLLDGTQFFNSSTGFNEMLILNSFLTEYEIELPNV
ncbi:MAG: hypothetical protein J6Y28_05690 [Acholeplasmatales bacterium]|nr:hypothetical protein [Acholeplasmatales bacterium]